MDIRPGDLVFGATKEDTYEVIRPIGNGSFGIVYEVRSKQGEIFALKTIITAWVSDDNYQALINEGKLATKIRHENVLRVFYFHDGKQYTQFPPYMIMEYANGGILKSLIDEKRASGQYLSTNELKEIYLQLASGMKAINEKLVHRDIKPDNILIDNSKLKISDFGLSKIAGAATRTNTFKGTNHIIYCAPEAWRTEKNTPAMDVYSMGIVFYELATFQYPYVVSGKGDFTEAWKNAHLLQVPKNPKELNPYLDLGLAQLIIKMLSKRPEDRYISWDAIIQRLQESGSQSENKKNVNPLLERALETHRKRELEHFQAQEKANQKKEFEDTIAYSINEVLQAGKETVEAFNSASDFFKLIITVKDAFNFDIYRQDRTSLSVKITVRPVYESLEFDGKPIKAWGYAKAKSGRGFNLILVKTGPDDLYGQWQFIKVTHNPIARLRYRRPEPFPFEFDELPRQIQLIKAFGEFQNTRGIFEPDLLDELIQELLEA